MPRVEKKTQYTHKKRNFQQFLMATSEVDNKVMPKNRMKLRGFHKKKRKKRTDGQNLT